MTDIKPLKLRIEDANPKTMAQLTKLGLDFKLIEGEDYIFGHPEIKYERYFFRKKGKSFVYSRTSKREGF